MFLITASGLSTEPLSAEFVVVLNFPLDVNNPAS